MSLKRFSCYTAKYCGRDTENDVHCPLVIKETRRQGDAAVRTSPGLPVSRSPRRGLPAAPTAADQPLPRPAVRAHGRPGGGRAPRATALRATGAVAGARVANP